MSGESEAEDVVRGFKIGHLEILGYNKHEERSADHVEIFPQNLQLNTRGSIGLIRLIQSDEEGMG